MTAFGSPCSLQGLLKEYFHSYRHTFVESLVCYITAVGVAHQALEEINPDGETVLVMGKWSSDNILLVVMTCNYVGCGPIGLLSVSIAKAMGATKV